MSTICSTNLISKIESVVLLICKDVESKLFTQSKKSHSEYELRKELISCILGSQMQFETTNRIVNNLEHAGLIDDFWWQESQTLKFSHSIYSVLSNQLDGLPHCVSHRFPKKQTENLTLLQKKLSRTTIKEKILSCNSDGKHLRKYLVQEIPGMGPKQASMFIRNIGESYELAVLDTHIIRFLRLLRIDVTQATIGTISGYEQTEVFMSEYAARHGYPTGYLDIAIWSTMKAARELGI